MPLWGVKQTGASKLDHVEIFLLFFLLIAPFMGFITMKV